jgi:hypothetical protein
MARCTYQPISQPKPCKRKPAFRLFTSPESGSEYLGVICAVHAKVYTPPDFIIKRMPKKAKTK